MADVYKTEIERALDELISNEEGFRFQTPAVVLAKQKWPELIACEPKKDLGTDAYAPVCCQSLELSLRAFLSSTGVSRRMLAQKPLATISTIRVTMERTVRAQGIALRQGGAHRLRLAVGVPFRGSAGADCRWREEET